MRLAPSLLISLACTAPLLTSTSALAQHRWDGDIRHFDKRDRQHWRGGHWVHTRHHGHLGWWWVVGPSWYLYTRPVYPYPDPFRPPGVIVHPAPTVIIRDNPPVVVAPHAPANVAGAPPTLQTSPYWYYCEPSKTYYPYVSTCEVAWTEVKATPVESRQ